MFLSMMHDRLATMRPLHLLMTTNRAGEKNVQVDQDSLTWRVLSRLSYRTTYTFSAQCPIYTPCDIHPSKLEFITNNSSRTHAMGLNIVKGRKLGAYFNQGRKFVHLYFIHSCTSHYAQFWQDMYNNNFVGCCWQ